GPVRHVLTLRHGFLHFGETVLVVTPPGALRMPNGIESDVCVQPGERVTIGGGVLELPGATVGAGPLWNPRPRRGFVPCLAGPSRAELVRLAGRGPGLTPLGDDILIGYIAGRTL